MSGEDRQDAPKGCHVLTWSKIAVGMASVAHAFGASTIPEILPSQGQQDSNK